MKKSIFRPIQNDEDCSDIVKATLIAVAIVGMLVISIPAGITLYQESKKNHSASMQRFNEQLKQQEADPAWRAEERRLKRKHGEHTVIYEPDREPYYYCGPDKKDKCRFM